MIWLFYDEEELEKAEEICFKFLDEMKVINNIYWIGHANSLLSFHFSTKRLDLEKAIFYTQKNIYLFDNSSKKNEKRTLMGCYHYLGQINSRLGKIEVSLEYYFKSLEIYEEIKKGELNPFSGFILSDIGVSYSIIGKYEKALEYQLESLKINLIDKEPGALSYCYFHLIQLSIILNDLEGAENYYDKMVILENRGHSPKYINAKIKLAKALLLKERKSIKNNAKAQEILEDILKKPMTTIEIYIIAMIHMIDLYIFEYQSFQSEDTLKNLQNLIRDLNELARTNKLIPVIVNSLILQGRLEIVHGNVKKAENIFTQALITAEENNLNNFTEKIKKEQENLLAHLDKWNSFANSNAPIRERFEAMEMEKYMKELEKIAGFNINLHKHEI